MSEVKSKLLAIPLAVMLGMGAVVLAQNVAPPQRSGAPRPAAGVPGEAAQTPSTPEEPSPLLAEPTTPEGMFKAAMLMQQLARPKLAKDYLQQLVESNPTDDALLDLRDKYGPGVFLSLGNSPDLQPFGGQLADRVNQLLRDRAADPGRIDSLINDLAGPPSKRAIAVEALRNTGAVVVPRMLLQLAKPEFGDRQAIYVQALSQMNRDVIPPLIGGLESPNNNVRESAIEALGLLQAREAVPYLWAPAYSPDQPPGIQTAARRALQRILKQSDEQIQTSTRIAAVDNLKKAAGEHLRRDYNWQTAEDGTVILWMWDPAIETVVPLRVTPDAASYYVGARLAKQALGLSDENRELQAYFLALSLANDATRAGWDQPLPIGEGTAQNLALTSGRDVVLDVVKLSLDSQNPAAALGALQVLRQIGSRDQLLASPGKQSPMMAALNYPDPRVQFSAATTVLTLDPDQPYAGAQRVVEILVRALQSTNENRSVVVDADLQRGDEVAGLLDQIGYTTEVARTGRQGFVAASEANDVNLILLETNTIRWPLSQTIANLRADSRTANIPIAIFGNEATQSRVESLTRRYKLVTFILEPRTIEGMKARIRPFLASIQTPPISPDEHDRQAAAAVEWLARIAGSNRTNIYDLSIAEAALAEALREPRLVPRALYALSSIGSKTAQGTLLEVAIAQKRGIEQREPAAYQLASHIQRHGLLLNDEQVFALKNAFTAEADPQMRTALSAVMGSLQPNSKAVGDRLKNSAGPMIVPAN